ncbi:MAG TPA: hypothetical protein VMD51_01970 [Mycobacterium sp.]|nr:hypothetical protein [Mycobacterium sp.]
MSRLSDAKKARRKKRQAGRDARWIPEQAMDALLGDEFDDEPNELERAVETFNDWLTSRGWTFDTDFTGDGLASWYFGASATEFDDERLEPVTRVWFKLAGGDDDFPNAVSAVLVGTGEDRGATYTVTPEVLLEHIGAIEAYRDGDAAPALG